jgi:hypothetical protein
VYKFRIKPLEGSEDRKREIVYSGSGADINSPAKVYLCRTK